MSGRAYYNEKDRHAAAWLRELIQRDLIAPGEVDERSIEDVKPSELSGFTQCHFFAGVGVWSYALRLAGWPDNRPVWTGSCPCQPFSAAGEGAGFADERHLWPAWFHLIAQCQPQTVFGEQVASKAALAWLDLVFADLEGSAYACAGADLSAAGVGAPHVRQRLLWVAHTCGTRLEKRVGDGRIQCAAMGALARETSISRSNSVRLGNTNSIDVRRNTRAIAGTESAPPHRQRRDDAQPAGETCRLADANGGNAPPEWQQRRGKQRQQPQDGIAVRLADTTGERTGGAAEAVSTRQSELGRARGNRRTNPLHGFWADADWIGCRDGSFRPVEPGSFPLVDGAAARMVRSRGYGNAIVAPLAAAFIGSFIDLGKLPT